MGVHQQFVGEIMGRNAQTGMMEVDVKNHFKVGDTLELMTPQGNHKFKLSELINKKGHSVDVAPGSGHVMQIPINLDTDLEYALLMRDLPNAPTR